MGHPPVDTPERDKIEVGESTLDQAIRGAQAYCFSQQQEDGHWCAELEGDTILETEYVLTHLYLRTDNEAKLRKAAEYVRRQQIPDGGWAIYEGGPTEISASVKAYFVLKYFGDDPQAEHMVRARRAILAAGGIEATNSFTKIYLAIFDQYPWKRCPAIPPEMILAPRWFPFTIYDMSSWTRAIVVPLAIMWAHRPHADVPEGFSISELFADSCDTVPVNAPHSAKGRFWWRFFLGLDRLLKLREAMPLKLLRGRALRGCEKWTVEHLRKSDGAAGIFPPIINTLIAFDCLGYDRDDPLFLSQIHELEKLEIEEEDTLRVQPCFSPVWDTSLLLNSLLASGVPADDERVIRAARWLLEKEVTELGDWQFKNPGVEPGGWYFEYANEFYPDVDDTAEVLTVLNQIEFPDEAEDQRRRGAMDRALRWLLSMQNRDGGWAAFDKECEREIFTYIPFADHNAMLDPSCEDITGRTLEGLAGFGFDLERPEVARAITFLKDRQEADGTWYGRWGCNYIYGTWLVLSGLRHIGADVNDPRYQRAGDWLESVQNPDGGWGESPRSYDEPELRGKGPSTAAQTAWAILALEALGRADREAVERGVSYLLGTQRPDGCWFDVPWTATGFPRVFYLRYHYYATYFPLLALAVFRDGGYDPGRLTAESRIQKGDGI